MPTPDEAFAAVAATLGGVAPDDPDAVRQFYEKRLPTYSEPVQNLIGDYLIATTSAPSATDLDRLKKLVQGSPELIPKLEAVEKAARQKQRSAA